MGGIKKENINLDSKTLKEIDALPKCRRQNLGPITAKEKKIILEAYYKNAKVEVIAKYVNRGIGLVYSLIRKWREEEYGVKWGQLPLSKGRGILGEWGWKLKIYIKEN